MQELIEITSSGNQQWRRSFELAFKIPISAERKAHDVVKCDLYHYRRVYHYKYIFQNFKQSDSYRSNNPAVVPSYQQGRPKRTVLHCLHRRAKSNKVTQSIVMIKVIDDGKFEVQGKNNNIL